jgi:hypothetical protein
MSHRSHPVPVSDNRYRDHVVSRTYCLLLTPVLYLLAFLFFPLPPKVAFPIQATNGITSVALPQERRLESIEHVLTHLEKAERKESNAWFRDDYRIAWIAIFTADIKGEFDNGWDALVSASYRVIGLHPDKVWPAILARREALLGPEAIPHKTMKRFPMGTGRLVDEEPTADGASSLPAYDSPKKPCKSTRHERKAA